MLVQRPRVLLLALLLAMALPLAACSSDDPAAAPLPTTSAPAAEAAPTGAPPASEPAPTSAPTSPTQAPVPTPEQAPATSTPNPPLEGVRGIVDPTNFGWPREVEGLNGVVGIPAKPERIIAASVGHDETVLALAPANRLVAVGAATKIETYSHVHRLVQEKPEITRDPETIIAQAPDVVVTSPFFPSEGIEALERVGIPVVQTELQQGPEARINNILLIGYILGEEERAMEFAAEVQARYEAVVAVTQAASPKPGVLAITQYSDQLWVAGGGSTEGGVILAAGGVNVAEAAGITSNQTTNLEGVITMAPEVIIIPQPVDFGANEFRQSLLDNEALAEVPAIKNGRVFVVESKHFTTLSFWNIRGAEDLARMLWPEAFQDKPSPTFSRVG